MTHVFVLDAGQEKGASPLPIVQVLRARYQTMLTSAGETASDWWIQRKLFGWGLLDMALQQSTGTLLSECEISHNEHGKPEIRNFPDLHYNLSHAGPFFIVAISRYPVGVDIEVERKITPNLAGKVFTQKEQKNLPDPGSETYIESFLRIWTKKESYTKMLGVGFQGSWHQIETSESIDPYVWKTMDWKRCIFSICYRVPDILILHPLLSLKALEDFYPETV